MPVVKLSDRRGILPALNICRCRSCGLLFVADHVTEEQLVEMYARADSDSYYKAVEKETTQKAVVAIRNLSPIVHEIDHALDVGSGYGHFMKLWQLHYPRIPIAGLETSDKYLEYCRQAGFEMYRLGDALPSFSLFVMLDVAEHVLDPVDVFQFYADHARPGAYLYIHTPRQSIFDTVAIHLGLSYWLQTRVSLAHLQLWSDEALTRCLQKTGWEVVTYQKKTDLSWPLERYLRAKFRFPHLLAGPTAMLARIILRTGILRNKAIVLAKRA